jgi:hypothetical protein
MTWSYNGYLFDANTAEISTLCAMSGNCGRPHIVYSSSTQTYVLWVNAGSPGYVIFTSATPTSGYVLSPDRALISNQTSTTQGGDFSVAIINGTGYLAYALIDFSTLGASIWPPFQQSLWLQPLTSSLTNTTGTASHIISGAGDLVDFTAESPDIFVRGDYYYVSASNTCGFCDGTLLVVSRSTSPAGPWTRQILSSDTCGGQTTGVLTLPSTSSDSEANYLHQADLFSSAPIYGTRTAAHGHQFQALDFNSDGSIQDLNCTDSRSVTLQIVSGNVTSSTGLAVTATDGSGQVDAAYSPECLLPRYALYQTWTSSKTGNLAEVGVNVAGDNPTGPLSAIVFRYGNETELLTAGYVWETLGNATVEAAEISQAFEVVRVQVGAQVKAGDKLGIALSTISVTSLCVLVTGNVEDSDLTNGVDGIDSDTGATYGNKMLFANGVGQVSPRGSDGTKSPVVVLPGEIKWYATTD